jgi:hypothetical protein
MKTGIRIKLIVTLSLLIPGLVLAAGTGVGVASVSTGPGHTIASAGSLAVGGTASGGGGKVDFWKVALNGGDVVQFNATTPSSSTYVFALFAPGTNDTNFPAALSFSSSTSNFSGASVFDLQAPYNGTFILAVCEGPNVVGFNCAQAVTGSGINPMASYSFKTSFVGGGVSSKTAGKETKASPAIKGAPSMGIGNFESGGGGPVDFWKVSLNGGDVVQFAVTTPSSSTYAFALFAPGTNDTNFPASSSFSSSTSNFSGKTVFDLQAPYNGTFVLAVCQGPNVVGFNCAEVDTGGAISPMNPYTFTTSLVGGGVPAKVAAKETKASPTIKGAGKLGLGNLEAGGGGPVDFWKIALRRSDVVQFAATTPSTSTYVFALYKGGTNDTNFPAGKAVSSVTTNFSGKSVLDLRAPADGTFVLAVCQGPNVVGFNCAEVDTGGAFSPMSPYTFKPSQTGGHETRTSLKLSASTVTSGHEKSLKFSVTVHAVFGGRPTGKVRISDGKKTVCTVSLVKGKGTCSPAAGNTIPVGKYSVTASYTGNLLGSSSATAPLTIRR